MRLGTKTTILIAATFFIALLTASLFLLHYEGELLRHTISEGLDGQAEIASHAIGSFIDDGLSASNAVAASLPTDALFRGRLGEVESYLKQMSETFPAFQNGMFILDREGKMLVDYPVHPEVWGDSFAFREYYRRTVQEQKGIVGQPYKSKRTGETVLTFTAPVRDASGQIIAIVACSVDLLSPEALGGYRKQKFGKTGYLYVFDKSRELVLHPDPQRELTYVKAGKNKVLESALTGFEGAGETVNSMGVPMLLAVRHIPHTNWIVGVQVPQSEAFAPIAESRVRIFLVLSAAMVGAILIGGTAIRRVTRPLQQLERVASRISTDLEEAETKGVYKPSPSLLEGLKHIRSHDEIGQLASSFVRLGTKLNLTLASLQNSSEAVRLQASALEQEVVERKRAEEAFRYQAYYDALTGLPNRSLFQDRLAKALADARRRREKVALLFLDLDRFKTINDSLGHSFGDLLLQDVAERLKRWAREQDTVARVAGDEFLIVLTGVRDIPDAAVAAERLMDTMTPEFVVQGHFLSVSCSIGISIFPEHGADGETLIKNADAAMYCAKDYGRNNFRFFTEDMNAQAVERLTLENSLRLALEKNELFLVYQPQMDIATGRITGLEALLRWQHPELGLVPPDKFIRIAENSGLIVPIGEWVLRTACSQARKWQDEGLLAVPVAVNVSAVQFRQEGFRKLIARVLHETGLAPQCLELELKESLLLANADATFSVLQELKAMGLKLAIDDFGTGNSSLSYLKQSPVSKLKIDRSFVRDVAVNPDDAAITAAIIGMAKSLNLNVIAEGVENDAQMSFLRAHNCDEIQGYYFSKPLSTDEVVDKLLGTPGCTLSANHGAR
jgi:diguanylate cyclase (GGDEF)-like protein